MNRWEKDSSFYISTWPKRDWSENNLYIKLFTILVLRICGGHYKDVIALKDSDFWSNAGLIILPLGCGGQVTVTSWKN